MLVIAFVAVLVSCIDNLEPVSLGLPIPTWPNEPVFVTVKSPVRVSVVFSKKEPEIPAALKFAKSWPCHEPEMSDEIWADEETVPAAAAPSAGP